MSQAAEDYAEPDWDEAVAKSGTPTQERYADWFLEKAQEETETAYKIDLDNKKQLAAFRAGFILSMRFRMVFQASPENQKARATAAKVTASKSKDEDDDEDEKPAKKSSKAKKGKAAAEEEAPAPKKGKTKKTKPEPEPDDEDDEEDEAPKAPAKSKTSKGKRGGKQAF